MRRTHGSSQEERPATTMSNRVLKIRIKASRGTAKAASQSGTGTGADAPTASQQGAPTAAASVLTSEAVEQRRKLLEGYPEPSASADAIVSCLRALLQGHAGLALPCAWEDCLVIPASLTQPRKPRRDAKRLRDPTVEAAEKRAMKKERVTCSEQAALELSPGPQQPAEEAAASPLQQPPAAAHAEKCEPQPTLPEPLSKHDSGVCKQAPESFEGPGQHAQGPGSSTSDDQATMTMFPSPDEEPAAVCQQEHAEEASARPSSPQQPAVHLMRPSVGCQAGDCTMLPLSCLGSPGCSSAAASMCSVSPFELNAPRQARRPADRVDDAFIDSILEKAKKTKRAADKQRGGLEKSWSVDALCNYVHSAIMFMEACEYILRASKEHSNRLVKLKLSTVQGLYGSTAKLLSYTASAAESAQGTDLSRDALRLLTERLCAMCHMREAVHTQARIQDAARSATQLSAKFQSQPAPSIAEAGRHAAGAGMQGDTDTHGQPSPNDSTNSSQDVVMHSSRAAHNASASQPAAVRQQQQQQQQPYAESIQRLLEQARQVARFSDLMRRSTLGFQTFLERPDYRSNQQAKLVSMHIAVVSMDFGMVDGFRLLSHATRALGHISAMSVAAS